MTPFPIDDTHRPDLESWVESAADPATDFPLQNLPLGIFRRRGSDEAPRPGVAIGDQVLDLSVAAVSGLLAEAPAAAGRCSATTLNGLAALPLGERLRFRRVLHSLLRTDTAEGLSARARAELVPQAEAQMLLPLHIGDYTDFYASVHHATNVGRMFRPDNPLLPNYKWVPIGYHGRASSIVPSGTRVRRPVGQTRDDGAASPSVGPTKRLDYELEVGFVIGQGNPLGTPIPLADAESHLFGLCLLNDWSARDVQTWEYQPLGPFLAKNFASTISPWIVTAEALTPFRTAAFARTEGDPAPLPYLADADNERQGGFDVRLEVSLTSERMRAEGMLPARVSSSRLADLYWTAAQFIAHHTVNGCNLQPGDLLGSGTVSGEAKDARGCLLELTWRGTEPLTLPTGETRRFLEDGDEVIMRGACEREGFRRIGFGECRGIVSS
ncbi:MAG TPA: fumarylacetoacetase [Gemmatimonadales bacterium]|nr:fumarylacetoacetase [Gemmatimonadales bacterium]